MADTAIILHKEHIAMHNSMLRCEKTRLPVRFNAAFDALQVPEVDSC